MWSQVWDAVVWAWTYAFPAALVGFLLVAVVVAPREPVRRAPWAGEKLGRETFFYVGLVVFLGGDALLGGDRPVYERIWKGAVVLLVMMVLSVGTVRWLRAGRPDDPLPVDDELDDDEDDDDEDDDDVDRPRGSRAA